MPAHPSPELPQDLVDKVVERRGTLHAHPDLDPRATALVVVDFDQASVAREPELAGAAIARTNSIGRALRDRGGVVAFVTSRIADPDGLAARLGESTSQRYIDETAPGRPGTRPAAALVVGDGDLHAIKSGASAFFPGKCDLDDQLRGIGVTSILIAGLVTNICCESTGRDAYELGYEVTMVSDALVGHSFGLHEASLATFFRYFGDVRTTDDALALLAPK